MGDLNENGINNPGIPNGQNENGVNNPASGQGHAAGINLNSAPAKTSLNWMRNREPAENCPDCAGSGRWQGQFCAACHGSGRRSAV